MSRASEFAKLQSLPPVEAMAYMAGRGLTAETYHWYDLWQSEHARAFTVSRLARADLLEAIQASLSKSVGGDLTRRDWINSTEQLLKDAGWWGTKEVTDPRTGELLKTRFNHPRLQLIFDTNSRQAAAAGQWQRIERNQRTHPYVRYVTAGDDRVRDLHRQWNNVTLPISDPWWHTHRPPNGWRCRCRVIGVTQREYDAGEVLSRPGAEIDRNAPIVRQPMVKAAPPATAVPWRNPATGELQQVPAGIDPGFDYNLGTTGRSKVFDAVVQAKLARMSPGISKAVQDGGLVPGLPVEDFMGQRPGLADLPPVLVTKLTGKEFGANLSHAQLMAKATKLLQALQASDGLVNDDTGWLLTVNRKGVKKMGDNKVQSTASLQAVAALVNLVLRAVVVEQHADDKHANPFVASILRLIAPVEIDGTLYRVKLTIKNRAAPDNPAKLLHALESTEIEGAPLGTLLTSADSSALQSTQPTTGRVVTIADLLRGALRQDGQPFTFEP